MTERTGVPLRMSDHDQTRPAPRTPPSFGDVPLRPGSDSLGIPGGSSVSRSHTQHTAVPGVAVPRSASSPPAWG